MVLLFFVLDLCTLSPPLLAQVKQCLLELANLYALSAPSSNLKRRKFDSSFEDRIGLCYLQTSSDSSSNEVKIVYSPRGRSFNLRDFHYAVHHLPSDYYSPSFLEDSGSLLLHDLECSCILSDEVLYSAGSKEIEKKIILISSCLIGTIDSDAKKTLLEAADRCVSVEFVFLEQKSSQLSDVSENINKFRGQICDLENCSFNAYLPDGQVFIGLVKRWLRELKESTEERLQAHFLFQRSIVGSVNQIHCKLYDSIYQIMDRFSLCEAHRCHGNQKDDGDGNEFTEGLSYQVKKHDVVLDNIDNKSINVGEYGILPEASLRGWNNLYQIPSAIIFNIIERTSLASLSEGVLVGRPYFVTLSVVQETDTTLEESNVCQLNNSLFQGLCRALYSMNQGLICWSFCNLEIMRETAVIYYYLLQPSDSGLMLLRRLAGAEEFLPFPDANTDDSSNTKEIDCCIQQCLDEMELRDYNPVQHNGGFHQKLNQFVEESLQPGFIASENPTAPNLTSPDDVPVPIQPSVLRNITALTEEDVVSSGRDTTILSGQTCPLKDTGDIEIPSRKTCPPNHTVENDKDITCLTQEWEQLIVCGIPRMDSAHSISKMGNARTSPPTTHKPLDTRTSNILERLGNPKQSRIKINYTDKIYSSLATNANGTKENQVPIDIDAEDQGFATTSSLMKPTFQRLKRKLR